MPTESFDPHYANVYQFYWKTTPLPLSPNSDLIADHWDWPRDLIHAHKLNYEFILNIIGTYKGQDTLVTASRFPSQWRD